MAVRVSNNNRVGIVQSCFLSSSQLKRVKQLESQFSVQIACGVNISRLAELLVCSERNVSKLMTSLQKLGVISWVPGRGRGHHSQFTLLKSFEEALTEQLEQLAQNGNLNQAYRLAEQFGRVGLFQERMPYWLDSARQTLREQNTLMYLVPYDLPEWRPHCALSTRSILLIESVFDTLLRYDSKHQQIYPHLGHQLRLSECQIRVRIRNNITFHNGERLTPEWVQANFEMRRDTVHPYQILFRHLERIDVDGQWVAFVLRQNDPVFLHLLADAHSAIFDFRSEVPQGTGAYAVERLESQHWSLVRNQHYFGLGGEIERAEFWTNEALPAGSMHVTESYLTDGELEQDQEVIEQSGCTVLQFRHHEHALSTAERSWVVYHSRGFLERTSRQAANSVMDCHQDKGFHLFDQTRLKPSRPVVVEVRCVHRAEVKPLLSALQEKGIEVRIHDPDEDVAGSEVDIVYDCYAFGDDLTFQYYEWLLCGDVFARCLSHPAQQSLLSFVDTLMQESEHSQDFLQKLYRAEDWLIQNYHFCPLWRDHVVYQRADNVYGTETGNMGLMSLANMWLE